MTDFNIEKMLESRVEMLQSLQNTHYAVDLMLEGVALVVEGGPDGIQLAANIAGGPEMIVSTLSSLVTVIEMQQTEIAVITETCMIAQDALIEVRQIMDDIAEKHTE